MPSGVILPPSNREGGGLGGNRLGEFLNRGVNPLGDRLAGGLGDLNRQVGNLTAVFKGLGIVGFADALDDLNPDLMLVLGDRYKFFNHLFDNSAV